MSSIKVILHPTDLSSHSEQAFLIGCSLARHMGARLIVLHVVERPVIAYTGVMMAPPAPAPTEGERNSLREQLHQVQPSDPTVLYEHRLEEGDPATAILQVAREARCNLIVMGTHGRTGLRRLLMGSVAEQVVRGATCPVLTVRTALPAA